MNLITFFAANNVDPLIVQINQIQPDTFHEMDKQQQQIHLLLRHRQVFGNNCLLEVRVVAAVVHTWRNEGRYELMRERVRERVRELMRERVRAEERKQSRIHRHSVHPLYYY